MKRTESGGFGISALCLAAVVWAVLPSPAWAADCGSLGPPVLQKTGPVLCDATCGLLKNLPGGGVPVPSGTGFTINGKGVSLGYIDDGWRSQCEVSGWPFDHTCVRETVCMPGQTRFESGVKRCDWTEPNVARQTCDATAVASDAAAAKSDEIRKAISNKSAEVRNTIAERAAAARKRVDLGPLYRGAAPVPPACCTLSIVIDPNSTGTGKVTTPKRAIDCANDGSGTACSQTYNLGALTTTRAREGTGIFQGWSGLCAPAIDRDPADPAAEVETGSGVSDAGWNPCLILMNANKTLHVRFDKPRLLVSQRGPGTVTLNPAGTPTTDGCSPSQVCRQFDLGTTVSVDWVAAPGFITLPCRQQRCSERLVMNTSLSIGFDFFLPELTVSVINAGTPGARVRQTEGTGSILCTGASPAPGCSAPEPAGTWITLFAEPPARFSSWLTGPCAGSTAPPCRFQITDNVDATALFR